MATILGINGVYIDNFILDTPYKDTLDEELDQFNFQIKNTTRLDYKKYDKVTYIVRHGSTDILTKHFAIYNIVETWNCSFWTYQISCLSPTKILENLIINGMAETYDDGLMTLYKQLVRVKDKINAQLSYEGVGLTISFDSSITSQIFQQ